MARWDRLRWCEATVDDCDQVAFRDLVAAYDVVSSAAVRSIGADGGQWLLCA